MTELTKFWSDDAQYANFVRNSFRSYFKCPKCRLDFAIKRDSETNKRLRPYMLPCKHTVCESCILKNLRNFECPECLKPVIFPKSRINIREFVELDFYILGYLYHNDMLDDNREGIVLRETNQKAPIQKETQKCSECDREDAYGKCLFCKAFFCSTCFSRVHSTSKVLRNHRLERILSDDLNAYAPNRCYTHHNIIQYICITCDEELCKTCRRLPDHADHEVKRIFEENQVHRDVITNMMESLKRFSEVLSESEKNIRHYEINIRKYMTDVAEKISEHFSKLHGYLQMEQQIVMKQFNEFWEVPFDGIANMKNNLKSSKTASNIMRTNLEFIFKNIPSDRAIDGLLKKYSTYLETLPCKAQNIKFESNPVNFYPAFTSVSDFGTTCSINFAQPTTKFAMGSLYSYHFEILDFEINYPTQSDLSLINLAKMNKTKNTKNMKKKRSLTNETNPKYTVLKKKPFNSNAEIENFNEMLSLSLFGDPLGIVTNIISPNLFYIQFREHKPHIEQISNAYKLTSGDLDVNNVSKDIEPEFQIDIEIDKLYIIYNTDHEYYRAMVKRCCTDQIYNVYLVDLGLHIEINAKYFKNIKEEHLNIPYAAICCSMYNLMPNQGHVWNEEATKLFTQLTTNEVVVVLRKYLPGLTNVEWSVDLIANYQDNTYNMKDVLLYTGFAMEISEKSTPYATSVFARQEHCLQKRALLDNQYVVCRICSIENPLEFYAIQEDLIEERNDLTKSFNEIYSNEEVLKTIFVGYIQMCCATQVDGIWYRARIESINAEGIIDVFLVDEGKSITVKWNQLYEILKDFVKIKEFVFQCELLGVKTSQKDNYQWTEEALTEFKHLVQNPRVVIYINSKNNSGVYKVNLNVSKGDCEIDVAGELITARLCDPLGEYRKIANSDTIEHYETTLKVECIEDKIKTNNNEQNQTFINRTLIKIVEVINPSEFYVYVKQLIPGIAIFLNKLSSTDYVRPQSNFIWEENDHCIVNTNINIECIQRMFSEQLDLTCKNINFHRGIIVNSVIDCEINQRVYDIYLRDYGKIIRNVDISNIYIIPLADDNISDSAQRCHLAGVQPLDNKNFWSKTAIDFFGRIIANSDELSATLYGTRDKNTNSLPIILWVTSTNKEDALAPDQQNHAKLNCALVKMGYACYMKSVNSKDNILGTEWVMDKKDIIDDKIKRTFKAIDKSLSEREEYFDTYYTKCTNNGESIDSFEIIDLTPTDPTMAAPTLWLKPKRIHKTYFVGIPTYIDYNGVIYMHKSSDKNQLHKMRLKLDKYFAKYSKEKVFLMTDFGVNQACIAKYHLDNYTYRVIIKAINQDSIRVLFIDYGNEEIVTLKDILPYAPYANIQAYADTYKLIGIRPKGNESYSETVLDMIHKEIVGKHVTVRVPPSELKKTGGETMCSICDKATDLASMFIINHLVDPAFEEMEPINDNDEERLASMIDNQNGDYLMASPEDTDDMSHFRVFREVDDEHGSTSSGLLNRNHNFDELAYQFATSLDFLDSHHGNDEFKNEVDCTGVNSSPPNKKLMFSQNEYLKLKTDFDRQHLLNAKPNSKNTANAENALISEHYKKGFTNMCEEEMRNKSNIYVEDIMETVPFNTKSKEVETSVCGSDSFLMGKLSPFEHFSPSKTSTVRAHHIIQMFTFPKLKKCTSFRCTVTHIVQPDILYIVPVLNECEDHYLELDTLIGTVAPKLKQLQTFTKNTPCLVQYAKDNRWYRAIIKDYNKRTQTATVTYVDYLTVESVHVTKIKEITDQIKDHPLRFYEMRVVNINKNRAYYERNTCVKLFFKLRQLTLKANVISNDTEKNIINIELFDLKNNNIYEKPNIKAIME